MNCTSCDKALTGGLDTYGEVGTEFCQECYLSLMEGTPEPHVDLRDILRDHPDPVEGA